MAWKIFNIGKANAEIDRLVAENESLKAAKPADNSTQLADALASNEQISNQLTQANSDLATAKQNLATHASGLEKAQGEISAINAALVAACGALKLDLQLSNTNVQLVEKIQSGVSSTLAKLNVAPGNIPAGKPAIANGGESKTKTRAEFAKLNPVEKSTFCRTGGKLTD